MTASKNPQTLMPTLGIECLQSVNPRAVSTFLAITHLVCETDITSNKVPLVSKAISAPLGFEPAWFGFQGPADGRKSPTGEIGALCFVQVFLVLLALLYNSPSAYG